MQAWRGFVPAMLANHKGVKMEIELILDYHEDEGPEVYLDKHVKSHTLINEGFLKGFNSVKKICIHETHLDGKKARQRIEAIKEKNEDVWHLFTFLNSNFEIFKRSHSVTSKERCGERLYEDMWVPRNMDELDSTIMRDEKGEPYGEIFPEHKYMLLWIDPLHGNVDQSQLVFNILKLNKILSDDDVNNYERVVKELEEKKKREAQEAVIARILEEKHRDMRNKLSAEKRSLNSAEAKQTQAFEQLLQYDRLVEQRKASVKAMEDFLAGDQDDADVAKQARKTLEDVLNQPEIREIRAEGNNLVLITHPLSIRNIELPTRIGPKKVRHPPDGKYVLGTYKLTIPLSENIGGQSATRIEGTVKNANWDHRELNHPHIGGTGTAMCWGNRVRDNIREALKTWDYGLYLFYMLQFLKTITLGQEFAPTHEFLNTMDPKRYGHVTLETLRQETN